MKIHNTRLSISFALILISCPASRTFSQSAGKIKQLPTATELSMQRQGMVKISDVDSTILVSLMYARDDNFTGKILYNDLHTAYLHPRAAKALKRAQQFLRTKHPNLTLKIYDAARPMSVQQRMWNVVAGTPKDIYVSNPAHGGGLHNYGMAVDITIADQYGDSLQMGTKIDNMTHIAHIDREAILLKNRQITKEAFNNRRLLRSVMTAAGFRTLRTEWWHFNFTSRADAKKYYKVLK